MFYRNLKQVCVLMLTLVITVNRALAGESPNIVFIIVDSHRADALGANGHPFIKTPHLDQLAKHGVNFKNAFVTTAICAVSRASILSGQYQQRHKINDFATNFSDDAWRNTYPMKLKEAGYSIAQIGFLGVGNNPPDSSFDHWDARIPWMSADSVHQTDAIRQRAVEYIRKQQDSSRPFYLAVSFSAAHEIDPRDGVPAHYLIQSRFKDLYANQNMPVPASAAPDHWEKFPAFFKDEKNIGRSRWNGFFSSPELHQKSTRDYYRMITGLDEAVGHIVEAIRAHAPNTIVVYTSDHGFSLGEHGLMGKWYGFQKAIHVPLIIQDLRSSPTLPKGVRKDIVLNIDLAPTLLGMAGVAIPERMQGVNLFDSRQNAKRTHFFYEHTVFPSPLLPKMEGVVSDNYKYMIFTEHGYELFYDLRKDPDELRNLAENSRYQKVLSKYRKIYEEYKRSLE